MHGLIFAKENVYRHPVFAAAYGIFAVTLGMLLSLLVFRQLFSFPIVFFGAIAVAPVLMSAVEKDEGLKGSVFQRYAKSMELFAFIFLGMAVGFAAWYAVLPSESVEGIFDMQLKMIGPAGNFASETGLFWKILSNNLGLVFAFFLMSLFYGYGSVVLLVWNSSVLGILWGTGLKALFSSVGNELFLKNVVVIFPYLALEVTAYFLAAIGGSILYISMSKNKNNDAVDESLKLLGVALFLILLGAIVETVILAA